MRKENQMFLHKFTLPILATFTSEHYVPGTTIWIYCVYRSRDEAKLFKNEGQQGGLKGEADWALIAALHRPLYKVSFHSGTQEWEGG